MKTANQRGQGMTEYIILIFVLIFGLVIGFVLVKKNPELLKISGIVMVYGAIIGALGWSVKRAIDIVNSRARLVVKELLSDESSNGLLRDEIDKSLRKSDYLFRLLPGISFDALAYLSDNNVIYVKNKKYFLRSSL